MVQQALDKGNLICVWDSEKHNWTDSIMSDNRLLSADLIVHFVDNVFMFFPDEKVSYFLVTGVKL